MIIKELTLHVGLNQGYVVNESWEKTTLACPRCKKEEVWKRYEGEHLAKFYMCTYCYNSFYYIVVPWEKCKERVAQLI